MSGGYQDIHRVCSRLQKVSPITFGHMDAGDRKVFEKLLNPGPKEPFGDFLYRLGQQLALTGIGHVWVIPNKLGGVEELQVIPTIQVVHYQSRAADLPGGCYLVGRSSAPISAFDIVTFLYRFKTFSFPTLLHDIEDQLNEKLLPRMGWGGNRVGLFEEENVGELKPKSILDGIPVDDKAFPLNPQLVPKPPAEKTDGMGIVSDCPKCGAPIYGKDELPDGATEATVVFTCTCRNPRVGMAHHTK